MVKFNFNYLVPVALLLGSIFFLTPVLTGNVIFSGVNYSDSRGISIALFFAGIFSFLYFKKRNEHKV